MSAASELHSRIAAVCPIEGVCLAPKRIDFAAGATSRQRADAQVILDAFDPVSDSVVAAAVARLSTDETERVTAKGDSQILALINQTKAEWNTWAQANFPSLTAAERTRLGVLFWVVSVAARRLLRNG